MIKAERQNRTEGYILQPDKGYIGQTHTQHHPNIINVDKFKAITKNQDRASPLF